MSIKPFFKRTQIDPSTYTIAFYNLENLFDTRNDHRTLDEDFLPDSEKRWDQKKYESKLFKLGKAISYVGFDKTGKSPSIVGLAEVENKTVVEHLVRSTYLKKKDYGVVHYDSPDERGIDTALIYEKSLLRSLIPERFLYFCLMNSDKEIIPEMCFR